MATIDNGPFTNFQFYFPINENCNLISIKIFFQNILTDFARKCKNILFFWQGLSLLVTTTHYTHWCLYTIYLSIYLSVYVVNITTKQLQERNIFKKHNKLRANDTYRAPVIGGIEKKLIISKCRESYKWAFIFTRTNNF